MNRAEFYDLARELQFRAHALGFAPCAYRARPGQKPVIAHAPGAKTIKVDMNLPFADAAHAMWRGTLRALGINQNDPLAQSFLIAVERARPSGWTPESPHPRHRMTLIPETAHAPES